MTERDQRHGQELALRFLAMCQEDRATGTALLNAIGNALVGFFMETPFENHPQRMHEVDLWCATLRREVDKAYRDQRRRAQ
jgi:hypothetical protein